uniref:Amino acid transporter transmembrane domain-containing protein n=1 Tax=Pavo cristatus TaxID=9049 RepID=A0A8C9FSP1_PAVCR
MPFKAGLELTELQNMTIPADDNISNDSNDFTEVENGQINSKFISDRESRRSLTNSHLEKKKCDEYIPGTTSLGMSVFNLSNAIMGSGILGLAFALANTGIFLFSLLLVSVTLLSIYSIHLLLVCSKETGNLRFYSECEECQKGFEVCSWYFLNVLYRAWYVDGRILVVAVTFGIILPLCLLKNLGYLGYTSGFSLSCMVFFLIVVIYKKFQILCLEPELNTTSPILSNSSAHEHMCKPKYVIFNSKVCSVNGQFCSPEVLVFASELMDNSYLTVFSIENVQSDLLHKYQSKDDILILTVRLAVIVAVILTVPVLFFTVRSSLFELARKTKFDLCRHVLVTFVLLVIINLLVIFIPTMKDIFGVVGVTSANMLIFILPSSLYLKITHQDGAKFTQRIWASLFLALGIMFSLVSIPLVIYDWVQSGGSTEGSD